MRIPLIVVERAFYKGSLLKVGHEFVFEGEYDRIPKWAMEPDKARAHLAQRERMAQQVDLRPIATQQAVRKKQAQFRGDEE